MRFPVKAVANKLIVIPDEKEEVAINGIILPGNVAFSTRCGEVQSAGEETQRKEGDYVVFPAEVGYELEGTELLIIDEEDVLAVGA